MNNNRRIRRAPDVPRVIAIVLGTIGLVYIFVALTVMKAGGSGIAQQVLTIVFGSLGCVFTIAAIILLSVSSKNAKGRQEAIDGGYYVDAVVSDVYRDRNYRVNGRSVWRLECQYTDHADHTTHVYRSDAMLTAMPEDVTGRTVRVYINRMNEKYYVVDVDELIGTVVYH